MIPLMLILKALVGASDKEVFGGLVQGENDNTFLTDRVELLLRGQKAWDLHTGKQCLDYLGDKFRVVLNCAENWDNVKVGTYLLSRVVLVHLPVPRDKFRMLMWVILPKSELLSLMSLVDSCCESCTLMCQALLAPTTQTRLSTRRFSFRGSSTE